MGKKSNSVSSMARAGRMDMGSEDSCEETALPLSWLRSSAGEEVLSRSCTEGARDGHAIRDGRRASHEGGRSEERTWGLLEATSRRS